MQKPSRSTKWSSNPNRHQEKIWLSYGHVLKTVGRRDDSVSAYRKAVELKPEFGEAYWSLANLKTARFSDDELALMHAQLERP